MDFPIPTIDTGLIIFFLGVIVVTIRSLKKDICDLKLVAWKNHPEDMEKN